MTASAGRGQRRCSNMMRQPDSRLYRSIWLQEIFRFKRFLTLNGRPKDVRHIERKKELSEAEEQLEAVLAKTRCAHSTSLPALGAGRGDAAASCPALTLCPAHGGGGGAGSGMEAELAEQEAENRRCVAACPSKRPGTAHPAAPPRAWQRREPGPLSPALWRRAAARPRALPADTTRPARPRGSDRVLRPSEAGQTLVASPPSLRTGSSPTAP